MDILIHTLSGSAVGGLVANLSGYNRKNGFGFMLVGALVGAFPDIDAISLWSGFDETLGKFFELEERGSEIYSGKHWYSHHAFTHSLLWCLLSSAAVYLIAKWGKAHSPLPWAITAFFGALAHIVGDMPTPAGSWGGVALFFPSENYVGGWGKTWWWNNYDVFLVLLVMNIGFIGLIAFWSKSRRLLATFFIVFGMGLIVRQISSRSEYYNYDRESVTHGQLESASKQEQQTILGQRLYRNMEKFDRVLPFYF